MNYKGYLNKGKDKKLAFITIYDPADINAWSGTSYYALNSIKSTDIQIDVIGNLKNEHDFLCKAKDFMYKKVFSRKYISLYDPIILKGYADQITKALKSTMSDIIFSIWSNPIAYLESDKPIILWGDATFASMLNFYPTRQNLCSETIICGHRTEQLSLSKCSLALYSSEWAAKSAINDYGATPEKVKVVPFGANIVCNRDEQDIKVIIKNRKYDVCTLLFVAVEWARKGGDIAIKVAEILNKQGIPCELLVVGCQPPFGVPSFVKPFGFISKSFEGGRRFLDDLFTRSHFLIMPSRAEAYGVVFAEASSFGLPSLATNVGGIPTAIHDGKNGFTFPLTADPSVYCEVIERFWSSREMYEQLALSSFREYEERLNWKTAGQRVHDLILKYCL